MTSRIVYGIGVAIAISLFLGNVMVVALDLKLTRPMYLLSTFGYMSGFLIALFGALFQRPAGTPKSHGLKLGILLVVLILAVRNYAILFRGGENSTNVWPPFFGAVALLIIAGILTSFWFMAQKLAGKEGAARLGVELQLASLVLFALAATLTCSLGALSSDTIGVTTMTSKVIALVNSESTATAQKVTRQEYGTVISYQVIGAWVVAIALQLVGNILELKSAKSQPQGNRQDEKR
ncbi:MAG: hypothetical protein JXR76_03255 [Deltaproteobacteria bacterium]|nr:hypothetical protein [Deltaproteobacteria bacterium]